MKILWANLINYQHTCNVDKFGRTCSIQVRPNISWHVVFQFLFSYLSYNLLTSNTFILYTQTLYHDDFQDFRDDLLNVPCDEGIRHMHQHLSKCKYNKHVTMIYLKHYNMFFNKIKKKSCFGRNIKLGVFKSGYPKFSDTWFHYPNPYPNFGYSIG